MKNILKSLLLILMMFPILVHADMGAPSTIPYDIIITKEGGIDYYNDFNYQKVVGHLNKDDVATVIMEYDDMTIIQINDQGYYIKKEGIIAKEEEISPLAYGVRKQAKIQKALVNDKNGVQIKKGPASIYDVVGTIPYNTELTWQYYIDAEGMTYIYAEYNGLKGWVSILNKGVLLESKKPYLFERDKKTECGIIPANTVMYSNYHSDMWSRTIYFTYQNCFFDNSIYEDIKEVNDNVNIIQLSKETSLYEYIDVTSGKTLATIPKDAKVTEIVNATERGDYFTTLFVKYQDKYGWIMLDGEDINNTKETANSKEYIEELLVDKSQSEEPAKEQPNPAPKEEPSPTSTEQPTAQEETLKVEEIIIMSVIAGIGIGATALGLIILLNKNKKKESKTQIE